MEDSARCIVEVSAGVLPGRPEHEFSRRWVVTTSEWEEAQQRDTDADPDHRFHAALLLAFRAAEADEYARLLRNPGRFNWVQTQWIWL